MSDEAENTSPFGPRQKQPRNEQFGSNRPFQGDSSLTLLGATGSLQWLNATYAQYSWGGWSKASGRPPSSTNSSQPENQEEAEEPEGHLPARRKDDVISFLWRSRDNRKGRHALVLRGRESGKKQPHGTLTPTNTLPATIHGLCALVTRFPYWDISWWVAVTFVLGSAVWVANGFIVLLPASGLRPSSDYASAWSGFAGAGVFFVGSVLLMLEAINANRDGCFGWAVEQSIHSGQREADVHPGQCEHHHHNGTESARNPGKASKADNHGAGAYYRSSQGPNSSGSQESLLPQHANETRDRRRDHWVWWPSWREIRTQLMYEIGFLACAIQLASAGLFWISKVPALPSVSQHLSLAVTRATQEIAQLVGCFGFISACLLFILETQPSWYMPAPGVLGWHVGFWKLVGCIGFTLSTVFSACGQRDMDFAEVQSSISSFWASWAILLGSMVQWYESVDKYPIIEEGSSRYAEWNEKYIKKSEEYRDAKNDENEVNDNEGSRRRRYGTFREQQR